LIIKTVILERNAILMETKSIQRKLGVRSYSTSSPKGGPLRLFLKVGGVIFAVVVPTIFGFFFKVDLSWIPPDQAVEFCMSLFQSLYHMIGPFFRQISEIWNGGERCAPLGGTGMENPTPSRSGGGETSQAPHVNPTLCDDSGPSGNHHLGAGVNTTLPAGDSSERPAPQSQDPDMEYFESLEPLVKIPTLPEMSPAGPSCGPEPEKKEQAPSVGLTLEPSQSSRRLDGGEQGETPQKGSKPSLVP
jgi:hypothetical protein